MRFRCRICGAELRTDTDPWEMVYPKGKSPYGQDYGHDSTKECPLHHGFTTKSEFIEWLKNQTDVEVIE